MLHLFMLWSESCHVYHHSNKTLQSDQSGTTQDKASENITPHHLISIRKVNMKYTFRHYRA